MKQCMAILLTICIFLPGCTAPNDELDIFHGDDLPVNDPEYDVQNHNRDEYVKEEVERATGIPRGGSC